LRDFFAQRRTTDANGVLVTQKGKFGVRAEVRLSRKTISTLALAIFLPFAGVALAQSPNALLPGPKPPDAPAEWKPWIGEYGEGDNLKTILERGQKLWLYEKGAGESQLREVAKGEFIIPADDKNPAIMDVGFAKDGSSLALNDVLFSRQNYGVDTKSVARIKPVRPVDELRAEALKLTPPIEQGSLRKPGLVEIAPLDSTIYLDIRYATANDFLGTPVYSQARAFLQRPAAEALLRVQHKLKPLGYGLLIHDAYRPWYVTKIFWDATPPEGKIFVADPAQGSRHNRGCAVDLTLYDLATGKPIEMPGTYDEMSPRSFPDYPGGTSLQRWHRDLLRRAMESEGFTVYEAEWWHFDYKDWKEYPILNVPFEKLGRDPDADTVH
jgi:D-alanyl-D-alanine dipeptidase